MQYSSLQEAVNAAAKTDGVVQLVQYKNDLDHSLDKTYIELPKTLVIPAGKNIKFTNVLKHTDSTGADYKYESTTAPTT